MAFSQDQLDTLEAAIAKGVRTVAYKDGSVTYSSLDEMLRIRGIIQASLAGDAPVKTVGSFASGLSSHVYQPGFRRGGGWCG